MNEREQQIYDALQAQGKIYGSIAPERFKTFDVKRIDPKIIADLKQVEDLTCELSDAMDRLGYRIGFCTVDGAAIRPLSPDYRAVGTAITQRTCPEIIRKDEPDKKMKSRMSVRDVPWFAEKDDVWVVDAKGCPYSHFGEIAAKNMQNHGLAGTILDGVLRDTETIKRTGYPIWCRGTTPLSGMGRVETVEINGTVTIDRVQVNPGDLVAADANGLCFIPAALVDEVYAELKNSNVIA